MITFLGGLYRRVSISKHDAFRTWHSYIGAGTGPAGPAGPFSAEVET